MKPTFCPMKTNLRRLVWFLPICLLVLCSCDLHKKLADFHFRQGMKKLEAGDRAGALDDFSTCISQNPKFAMAYFYRGYIYLSSSYFVVAITNFDKTVELEPNNVEAYVDRGLARHGLREFDQAITNYSEAIKLDPENADAFKYRGLARMILRDWEGAFADFNQAVSLNTEDPEVYRNRAALQFMRQEYESTVADASKAIELNDKDPVSYRFRGLGRMRLRDFTNALADLDEAIALNPHDADAFAGRGAIRVLQGNFEGADADLSAATRLNPTNTTAMAGLGTIKIKRGDLQGALAVFTNVLAIMPPFGYPEMYLTIGHLQSDLHQDEAALQNLHKSLELDPRKNYARFRIWQIRSRHGEQAEVTQWLITEMKANPTQPGHEWESCIGRFLTGDLDETNFLAQAIETARRPVDKNRQLCEARYYAAMKRLYNGDKAGASELLEQCVALHEDNAEEYYSAVVELRGLKKE